MQSRWATSLLAALATSGVVLADDLLVTSWNDDAVHRYDAATGAYLGDLVSSGGGGLARPHSAVYGPDDAVYVTSFGTNQVLRVDLATTTIGVFVAAGAGGLVGPTDAFFGPDGNLFVASRGATPGIKRYDGQTGAPLGQFTSPGNGMIGTETGNFGPDGNFYLASGTNSQVNRYHGLTGDFIDVFLTPGLGGLSNPHDLAWGPDGNLYVTSFGNGTIKSYSPQGAYLGNFASGIPSAHGLDSRPDGFLYVASFGAGSVLRFDAASGAPFDTFVPSGSGGLSGAISLTFETDDELNLAGVNNTFRTFGANPGETVFFLIGQLPGSRAYGACPQPALIGLQRVLVIGTSPANSAGVASLTYTAPPTLAGQALYMQSLAPATCRSSGVLRYRFP